MVQYASDRNVTLVADFAAGQGELIRAAQSRWPRAQFIATDVNRNTLSKLRRHEVSWAVGNCDFLNHKSRDRCTALSKAIGKVSVALINPPFSCRGARYYKVEYLGSSVRCSLALAFVLQSLPYLAPDGQLIALLPAGCLTSQKDKQAWNAVKQSYSVEDFGTNGRGTFDGCHAETVIVRLVSLNKKFRKKKPIGPGARVNVPSPTTIRVFRGTAPMYLANGAHSTETMPLVHTTELERDRLNLAARTIERKWKSMRGPAVLIPRVGRPYRHKIKLYLGRKRIVLSDCVIALSCRTPVSARELQSALLQNWDSLQKEYGGTCAPYITLYSIQTFLESLGFAPSVDTQGQQEER